MIEKPISLLGSTDRAKATFKIETQIHQAILLEAGEKFILEQAFNKIADRISHEVFDSIKAQMNIPKMAENVEKILMDRLAARMWNNLMAEPLEPK